MLASSNFSLRQNLNIVSYRGPNAPGGVSSALKQVMDSNIAGGDWWYIGSDSLRRRRGRALESGFPLDEELLDKHYRYCNNFLWPVLHDMPQHAIYNEDEHRSYLKLNEVIARQLSSLLKYAESDYFVNDYQFAVLPALMPRNVSILVFWHIPWPRTVCDAHLAQLCQVAESLLSAGRVGFHTQEYVNNFLAFVDEFLPNFKVDYANNSVLHKDASKGVWETELICAPLGVDLDYWQGLSSTKKLAMQEGVSTLLAVDRADYTKGVKERLKAIDYLLERFPERRGKFKLIQICGRTRPGLSEFDKYWQATRAEADRINRKWQEGNWSPIEWQSESLPASELVALYKSASVMLVNPIRDGLNLTAKEFVAVQSSDPGVLLLSAGAGVWSEFAMHALPVNPVSSSDFALAIDRALKLSKGERIRRCLALRSRLHNNTLSSWWQKLRNSRLTSVLEIEGVCG